MMKDVHEHVKIVVTLPVCLHLDGREFLIPYRNATYIAIETSNIFSDYPTYLGTARNAEIASDSFSHFRFTKVAIIIPRFGEDVADPQRILTEFKKSFFWSLNIFIDAARTSLGRTGLLNYYDYSDFVDPVHAQSSAPANTFMGFTTIFPGRGLTSAKPLRSEAEHSRLQEILHHGLNLPDRFLLDAQRDLYYRNYIYALVNAVIALEIVVSDTIRRIAECKGINTSEINKFIQDVGLTGSIKSTLKLLTPKDMVLPGDDAFNASKAAISHRNNIMHRGQRDVPESDVPLFLEKIQMIIGFCEELQVKYLNS